MGRFYKSFAKFLQTIFYLTRIKDISVFSVYLLHDDSIELLICNKKKKLNLHEPTRFCVFMASAWNNNVFFKNSVEQVYRIVCKTPSWNLNVYMYIYMLLNMYHGFTFIKSQVIQFIYVFIENVNDKLHDLKKNVVYCFYFYQFFFRNTEV